jgi:hyperosmotically inducible periplasmic protein
MRTYAFILQLLVAVLILVAAPGCTTTQPPERQLDDAGISTNIKARLAQEQVQTLTNVEVNTTNGVVTLAGQVESEEVRRRAEEIARGTEGVTQVNNNLQVAGAPPPQPR